MKLPFNIEPQIERAKLVYPKVLQLILAFTDFCDNAEDEETILQQQNKVEQLIQNLTEKESNTYSLFEWWEAEGAEVLAFKIALPNAQKVNNISREELTEIVTRIKNCKTPNPNNDKFLEEFNYHLDSYYHQLLAVNFPKYEYSYFNRQKDKSGNYFEYNIDEIVNNIIKK